MQYEMIKIIINKLKKNKIKKNKQSMDFDKSIYI